MISFNLSMYDITPLSQKQKYIIAALEGFFIIFYFYLLAAFSYFLTSRKDIVMNHFKYRKVLPIFLVFLLFFAIMKSSLVMLTLLMPMQETNMHCRLIETAYQGLTVAAVGFIYTFLWLRQYTFYREPSLKSLVTPLLGKISKYLIVFVLLSTVVGGVAVLLAADMRQHHYIVETGSCAYTSETDANTISLYSCYIIIGLCQGLIVFLMFNIFKKHQNDMFKYDVRSTSACSFHKLVRRCTIAACCGLLVDVFTLILDTKLPFHLSQSAYLFMWDLNYVINIACLLFCFSNWRKMIFPWRTPLKKLAFPKRRNIALIV